MHPFSKCGALLLLIHLAIVAGCGGGGGGGGENNSNTPGINDGDLVVLSRNYQNSITRGKDIFDTVMKKYQPVIDFYGADTNDFQNLVNTILLSNSSTLTPSTEKLYNFDSLTLWEDVKFVVEYEDGSRESLPSAEILTITGDNSPSWYKNGKKIVNILTKLEDADKIREKIADKLTTLAEKTKQIQVLASASAKLAEFSSSLEKLSAVTKCMATFGQYAGIAGAAFSLAQTFGLFDTGPSADEIINMKLDHIIKLIEGLYTHMEYIENKLEYIEEVIVTKANKSVNLDLKSIINTVNGRIQELNNVISLENKRETAMEFRNDINGILQNYIDYSMADYKNFTEYQVTYAKDTEYLPHSIKINMPHRRIPTGRRNECILTNVQTLNPNSQLPFTYEGLEYLKNLIITRININAFIESEESSLAAYNSNTAMTYLYNDSIYIAKIRKQINQAYININKELCTIKNNINGPSSGIWTAMDHWTVKDNYKDIYTTLTETQRWCMYSGEQAATNFRLSDKFNYIPWFSSGPIMPTTTPNGNDMCLDPTHSRVMVFDVSYDFPYAPSLAFDSNDPVELVKSSSSSEFIDDAVAIIDASYKAKTNRLLEFTASLAALEIQLASYLDDEDYEAYKNK